MKCIGCLYEQEKPFKFCPECGAKTFDIVVSSVNPVKVEDQRKDAGDKSQKNSESNDEINSAAKIDVAVKSVHDNNATVPPKDSTTKDDSQNNSEGNDELNSAAQIDGAVKSVNDIDATVPPIDSKYEDEGTNVDDVGAKESDECNKNQTESKENIENQSTDEDSQIVTAMETDNSLDSDQENDNQNNVINNNHNMNDDSKLENERLKDCFPDNPENKSGVTDKTVSGEAGNSNDNIKDVKKNICSDVQEKEKNGSDKDKNNEGKDYPENNSNPLNNASNSDAEGQREDNQNDSETQEMTQGGAEKTDVDKPSKSVQKEKGSTEGIKGGKKSKKKNDKQDSAKKAQGTRRQTESARKEKVNFHVLLSKEFQIDRKTEELFICGEDYVLGGWKSHKHKMEKICDFENFTEYRKTIMIDTNAMINGFVYKYCFVNGQNYEFERVYHMIKKSGYNKEANRHLKVPKSLKNQTTGEWHQFDGFCYQKEEKSMWQRVTGMFKSSDLHQLLLKDLQTAAAYFLNPLIKRMLSTQKENIPVALELKEQVEMALHCIRLQSNGDEAYLEEDYFQEIMFNLVIHPLLDHLNTCEKNNISLMLAIFVIILTNKFEMKLNIQCQHTIYRNLLVQVNMEEKKCLSSDFIAEKLEKRYICEQISMFMKKQRDVKDNVCVSSWFYAVPLVHFLSGHVHPFSKIPVDVNHTKPEWWCFSQFEKMKDMFKNSQWNRPLEELMDLLLELSPLFQVDYLLPRTIIASLNKEDVLAVIPLGIIPVEICCAALYFYTKYSSSSFIVSDDIKKIKNCLDSICKLIDKKAKEKGSCNIKSTEMLKKITIDLIDAVLDDRLFQHRFSLLCTLYDYVLNINVDSEIEDQELKDFGHMCEDIIHKKIHGSSHSYYEYCYKYKVKEFLTKFHDVISLPIQEKLEPTWKALYGKMLTDFFSKVSDKVCLEIYCEEQDIERYCSGIQDFLSDKAFEEFNRVLQTDHVYRFEDTKRIGKLLSKAWAPFYATYQNNPAFLFDWTALKKYIQVFDGQKKSEFLTVECLEGLTMVISKIEDYFRRISGGDITREEMLLITEKSDKVKTLFQSVIKNGKVDLIFNIRQKELSVLQDYFDQLQSMLNIARTVFKEDADRLSEKFHELTRDSPDMPLNKLYTTLEEFENIKLENFSPLINPLQIPHSLMVILPSVHTRQESQLFLYVWSIKAKQEEDGTFFDKFELAWINAEEEWKTFCKEFTSGIISFQKFEKYKSAVENDKHLMSELCKVVPDEDLIKKRMKQYETFKTITTCQKASDVIMDIKDMLKISGDFSLCTKIKSMGADRSLAMKEIDELLLNMVGKMKEIGEEKLKLLQSFRNSGSLVNWLKETMKDGLKELKVFVDLAFISAGEGDLEIDRVNYFHTVTSAFAPLIFELPAESDFEKFMVRCDVIFKEMETDKKLSEKLLDTNRQLEWFKAVRQSHGSVEVTSLEQAEMIVSHGIYKINLPTSTQNKLEVQTVLTLSVSNKDDKKAMVNGKYSFEKLMDLQSRLMLVAGQAEKGRARVEAFTSTLDGVVRLAKAYVKLCTDGCVFFNSWRAEFLCDNSKEICARLVFGKNHPLTGHRHPDNVEVFVSQVANFLEQCHEDWLSYLRKKRREYLVLNYYTVKQLVFLQQEIIKVGTDEPNKLIYPLLSLLKESCCEKDLSEAMKWAEEDVRTKDKEETRIIPAVSSDNEIEKKFIDTMLNNGFKRELALEAFNAVSDKENIDEGLSYCMDNANDIEESCIDEEDTINTERFLGWSTGDGSIDNNIGQLLKDIPRSDRISCYELIQNFEKIWKEFLKKVSSSVSDYLSLEHLGIILQKLAASESLSIRRNLPAGLSEGQPNLIVCPSDDMLNCLTYMYMHPADQPLPKPDEVLICSKDTQFDEVDIFLRRAFYDSQNKVHCLAFADHLDYSVGDKCEKRLIEYVEENKGKSYKVVVFCTQENELKTKLVAALENYRSPPPKICTSPHIRSYLCEQFVSVKPNSASSVDFSSSTVRVIKSERAGVGKTLYKTRLVEKLTKKQGRNKDNCLTIPLFEKEVNVSDIADRLMEYTRDPGQIQPMIFHLDISSEVLDGVDFFLYNLLILGCIKNKNGYVWRKSEHDLYLIENIPVNKLQGEKKLNKTIHHMFEILPNVNCWSPSETLSILGGIPPKGYAENDSLFDETEFRKEIFQRPFQYLESLDRNTQLEIYKAPVESSTESLVSCLAVLLRHCGIEDPSWSEIHHFALFLNTQLKDWETSTFCSAHVAEDFPGFAKFVLLFSIEMSRDFATRSLKMSEETPLQKLKSKDDNNDESELTQFQIKRHWESSPHPYIFFNPDHHTMTFLGFNVDRNTGDLVDQQNGQIIKPNLMPKDLYDSLIRNRAPLNENFQRLPRLEAISKLCCVMGIDSLYDPDPSYELTPDNAKKILAIYMRFRCNIPVIIMGETGCGKTRLVKFMCSLQRPVGTEVQNMILMKVHGGTTSQNVIDKVKEATQIATNNAREFGDNFYTVLFFDEANTTESIGLIKEIMCDGTMNGKKFNQYKTLKIVAACNPYRKHTDELIKRLENAGLGYHVDADATTDRMGRLPMRRLVYRVKPLPASMLPLVWDFGQLNTTVENLYIQQMVQRAIDEGELDDIPGLKDTLGSVLVACQDFMRSQNNECSFVSLRDVERVISVMCWLLEQAKEVDLFRKITDDEDEDEDDENNEDEDEDYEDAEEDMVNDITIALILALAVCYRSGLRSREEFDNYVIQTFKPPLYLSDGIKEYQKIIDRCQECFLEDVDLGTNIAKNHALKENVFLMVVCMELRIPLFLVGKPGSSKSLAKTIVADAMQGNSSRSEFFKNFKQTHMVSFQCSPLSTADGILSTFTQCAKIQKDKNLDNFVATVVLDEIGLAEDSSKMPLKTLHPLLEDGCQGNEKPEPYMKVGFIGISNWALDPAKMNRGISVQREIPDKEELMNTADGICSSSIVIHHRIIPVLKDLAQSYLKIFEKAREKREFFGLRDFYSLVKMVYGFAEKTEKTPCWHQLEHCIKRNFGGLDSIDAVEVFKENLKNVRTDEKPHENDPDCSALGLIEAGLFGDSSQSENRYMLLLTENYGALGILQEQILQKRRVQTIFGSSFPRDQEYTQVCRNINRIKVCMETGNTVILLNLENLYESLYDALNQYYAKLGGERYVDLGLGSHRVKCRVHKNFRLIVVAEKKIVYEKFPIPLINRLEKHFLTLDNIMTKEQAEVTERLKDWASKLSQNKTRYHLRNKGKGKVEEAFMGYHSDAAAAIVLKLWNDQDTQKVFDECKKELLWCSTPEAVLQAENSPLSAEKDSLSQAYFHEQQHGDIFSYIIPRIQSSEPLFAQITTHSTLLTDEERRGFHLPLKNILLLNLQSFDTEQQFCQQIKNFVQYSVDGSKILIIQSDSHGSTTSLVKSAQYCVDDNLPKDLKNYHVIFIVQLDRMTQQQFTGYQGGKWHCLHIDDLHPSSIMGADLMQMKSKSVAVLFKRERDIQESFDEKMAASPSSDSGLEIESINISIDDSEKHYDYLTDEYFHSKVVACIQAAVGRVKDSNDTLSRPTQRVSILISLLKDDGSEFSKGIRSIISRLLLEKENERGSSHLASRWLVEDVCKSNKIHKTGTFRRAVGQYFEEKITPILAGIVAVLDKNFNLDIIKQAEGWKLKLWLEILVKNNLLDLKYLDFISREQSEVLNEFVVNNTGYGQRCFQSCFPFSWLYINLIDKTLTTLDSKLEELDDDIIHRVSMIICDQELITVLINLNITDEIKEDMYICYIRDFIQMKYSNINEDIQKVIFELLTTALRQCEYHVEEMEIYEIMVAVHYVFTLTRIRIHQFLEIVYIYPDVINIILQQMEKGGGNPLLNNRQMTFDVMALSILLESLEPEREQLIQPKGKREWYERACKYLTVTEKILDSSEEQNGLEYSPICREFLLRIRCLWTRIMTIKLFLEHFSSGTSKITDQSIRWQVLWAQLAENADLHKIECLQKVEKFLKLINITVLKKLLGEIVKCSMCGNTLESSPIQLPCQHKVCDSCFDHITSNEYQVCPQCQMVIPADFDGQAQRSDDNPTQKEIKNFQGNCNSFLMALVSKLCFTSNQAPEPAVIEKLMQYIAIQITPGGKSNRRIQTKPMSVFTNVIDPTPVCRLFLLQLLTKKSFDVVKSYLEKYFEFTQGVIEQETNVQKKQLFVEFCFLVCQCLEDMLYEKSLDDQSQDEIKLATQYLDMAAGHIQDTCDVTEKLNHISKCRFGLDIVAKYLNMYCKTKRILKADTKRLFNAAENVLKIQPDWMWPKKYLIKQICRMYGTDVYAELMEDEQFKWIGFVNKEPLVQDRYIIYGDNYLNIRKELSLVDMGSNTNQLELKRVKADWEIMFVMAVLSKVSTFQDKTSTFEKLKPFIEKNMKKKDMKELAVSVMSSEDGSSPLFSVRCTNIVETKNIEYLLCHWLLVLRSTPHNTILQPLVNLALNITTMKDSFLPTMPEEDQGNLNSLMAVLKQKERTSAVYRCPNGHPYVIGDCGKPNEVSKCNECGQDIGGISHNSIRNNQLDSGTADSTRKGHILGSANQRSKISTPERSLSPVMCSIIRLLTHMSLYLSSKTNEQDVMRLVEQKYVTGSIQEFFLQHIQKDIGVLHHALKKSSDDILLLMNILCKHLLLQLPLGEIRDRNMIILNTKEARKKWEIKMSAALTPVIQDMEALLENGNNDILTSSNSGADELLAIVYEKDGDEDIDFSNLQYNGKIWSYRERITVEHFFRKFQLQIIDKENEGQSFKIIRLFKQELYHLQVQRFLPSIIKLLHSLMQKFCRKIDRREALDISVEEVFKKEFTDNEEIQEHFDSFVQAWNILNEKLISHVCRIDGNILLTLPSEYHNMKLDLKSNLALFLPSTKGPGVCSYILVDFLCREHNEFLQSCCFLKKQEHKFEDITAVHSKDLTSFHLFSFHLVKDIQPLVLSNCHYSFDLQSKRSEMETMLFKADSSNALVFTSIRNHIPQIDISSVVKRQITEELHQKLTNICDSINNLDVATSFLKSLGGDPEMNIHKFMSDTLKMKTSITSATARSECKLKHIQSLWLIFSFEKEKILTLRNKDPFVDFEEGLNVKMTDQDKVLIEEECKKIPIDKLEVMLYFIYDNILLKIAQPEVEYREMKLRELLYVELENCSNFVDTPSEYNKIDGDIFMTWPETVLGVHAIQVWITILQVFTKKDEEYFG